MDTILLDRILELLTDEERIRLAGRLEADQACYHYYRKRIEGEGQSRKKAEEIAGELTEEMGHSRLLSKDFFMVLSEFIEREGMKDPDVYRAIGMHRNQWSRLRQKGKRTSKSFILKLCLVLRLDVFEANYLAALAGYTFMPDHKQDYAVLKCIREGVYDPMEVDEILVSVGETALFSEGGTGL